MRRALPLLPLLLLGCSPLELPASAHTLGEDAFGGSGGTPPPGSSSAPISDDEGACAIVDVLQCGQQITLNTATDPRASTSMVDYADVVGRWTGPELGVRFVAPSGDVNLRFVDPRPSEMNQDILILSRENGPCDGNALVDIGWNGVEPELTPGATYTLMVDGYDGDAGEFTLEAICDGTTGTEGVGDSACAGDGRCVASFPFDERDTTIGRISHFDSYSCSSADMSGPERVYEVVMETAGYLAAVVNDAPGVDVDVQILNSLDPNDCIDRGDTEAWSHVDAGTRYVVVDTFAGSDNAGEYTVDISAVPEATGSCATVPTVVERISGPTIYTPTDGRMVMEAHLVTTADGFGSDAYDPWPQGWTDGIATHYQRALQHTGFLMEHTEPWAPHNGNNYGQGAHWHKLPPEDEVWYMNMHWADRPAAGTRMILRANGRAIVAAAGYETGPGEHDVIGGATEEIHRYLGTVHRDVMNVGFAADQSLPLGPIDCE